MKTTLYSIDEILEELNASDDIYNILRVIYSYYLNEREKEYYHALLLNFSGKPQKEIGIILNIVQSHVSKFKASLLRKMKNLATLFTSDKEELEEFVFVLKKKLKPVHYRVVSYMLGGNRCIKISEYLNCSPANISKRNDHLQRYLTPQEKYLLDKYINIMLG